MKLWLVQADAKVEKHKTTVKSQSLSPTFNESFAFSLPPRAELDERVQLIATVMDYDLLSSNDEMGHAVIGSKGGPSGAKHWKVPSPFPFPLPFPFLAKEMECRRFWRTRSTPAPCGTSSRPSGSG